MYSLEEKHYDHCSGPYALMIKIADRDKLTRMQIPLRSICPVLCNAIGFSKPFQSLQFLDFIG